MMPQVGIAFAVLSLSLTQKLQLAPYWNQFPRGRYLMPFEIARHLGIELKQTINQAQEEAMKKTWIDFCKEKDMDQRDMPFDHGEWFGWFDFAAKNYHEPLRISGGSDWAA